MSGLEFLLTVCARGVRFGLDGADRAVTAIDPGRVVTGSERVLLAAIKQELRALLLTELPDNPGEDVCEAFDAAEGVGVCRRCARGIAEHFWRRAGLRSCACAFAIGGAAGERCRCGGPAAEHF
jgi:hypothetical protein